MREYELSQVTLDERIYFSAFIIKEEDWNGFALPYFTLSEALRLCEYLNKKSDRWFVMNMTDGIMASTPLSRVNAEKFIKEFPKRFMKQGYYLTAEGREISPMEVDLQIEATSQGILDSVFDAAKDCFIIQEAVDNDRFEAIEYAGEDIVINNEKVHLYPIGKGSWIWSKKN